jgi:hypothetical protein
VEYGQMLGFLLTLYISVSDLIGLEKRN